MAVDMVVAVAVDMVVEEAMDVVVVGMVMAVEGAMEVGVVVMEAGEQDVVFGVVQHSGALVLAILPIVMRILMIHGVMSNKRIKKHLV